MDVDPPPSSEKKWVTIVVFLNRKNSKLFQLPEFFFVKLKKSVPIWPYVSRKKVQNIGPPQKKTKEFVGDPVAGAVFSDGGALVGAVLGTHLINFYIPCCLKNAN